MATVQTLDIDALTSENYFKNKIRFGGSRHGDCRICGKGIKNPDTARYVHEIDGGGVITTDVTGGWDDPGDLGMQPVGPECVRKHRAVLKPYLHRM